MQKRYTIKIAGAAGQGIKSSGIIITKALKRAGFYTFGYTEYPSLIRGGHNVYQIEVARHKIGSISRDTDVLLTLNKESLDLHIHEFDQDGGIIIVEDSIPITPEMQAEIDKYGIKLYQLPLLELATKDGGSAIMKNTVTLGAIWKTIGLELTGLQDVIAEVFNKGEEIVQANKRAAQAGYDAIADELTGFMNKLGNGEDGKAEAGGAEATPGETATQEQIKNSMVITGNEALALGAIACGVSMYSSYPMTPASSILTNLAVWAKDSGMLIKQAEDEITAANMCIGANFAGTRALCGTSGGGLDLMSESISLAGITETPFVIVLAQRHGAGTGAPTWTGQSDLNLAINTAHGEFPRIVMSCAEAEDAFYLIGEAFNLAEKFQTPVLFLTDKYIAESTYPVLNFDQERVKIDRGDIIPAEQLTGQELRYVKTESGVSPRWYPGQHGANQESIVNSTFISNSDEHTEKGYSTEDEKLIKEQADKRKQKLQSIKASLPGPQKLGDENADIKFITWGSNKPILEDASRILREQGKKVEILHFTYLWPLKTEELEALKDKADQVYVVEQNQYGQLTELIKREAGIDFKNRILRYDSKPFYIEDILEAVK